MNLSSTVLLSCVLLSGLWGYDEPDRSPLSQTQPSEDACVVMEDAICNKSISEKNTGLLSPE
jgi:hypothetical protein